MESRARRPVGSGHHKTRPEDQKPTKTRPGQPHIPPRRGGSGQRAAVAPRWRQDPSPAEISRLQPGADLPETHPGAYSGGTRWPSHPSPGATGRTGPTVVRMMQVRRREHRMRPLLQSKVLTVSIPSNLARRDGMRHNRADRPAPRAARPTGHSNVHVNQN